MSSVYITEPPTRGKLLVHTSFGDLDVELWPNEAPLACRNFVQHCVDGTYDGTVFHRVVKDFMLQGGDPTGTGSGGESIWAKPFKDEIHTRLRFNHRGLLAMANGNQRDSNMSQFFFTLGPCEWLKGKHTIFGKVTGNTIFNLLTVSSLETNPETDRPLDPPSLMRVEVLVSPFDDIVARAPVAAPSAATGGTSRRKKRKKRDLKLLSFGEEAAEEEVVNSSVGRMISSHDVGAADEVEAAYPAAVVSSGARSHVEVASDAVSDAPAAIRARAAGSAPPPGAAAMLSAAPVDVVQIDAVAAAKAAKRAAKKAKKDAKAEARTSRVEEYKALREQIVAQRAVRVETGAKVSAVCFALLCFLWVLPASCLPDATCLSRRPLDRSIATTVINLLHVVRLLLIIGLAPHSHLHGRVIARGTPLRTGGGRAEAQCRRSALHTAATGVFLCTVTF